MLDELEPLMRAARERVLHLLAIVVAILAAISSQIDVPSPATPAVIVKIALWVLGCAAILVLGALWYGARATATRRLPRLLQAGQARITSIEVTPIELEIVPFGIEVDLVFESGERLAFGYWARGPAERLVEIVLDRLPYAERGASEG
jgi:hypothetical protein